MQIITKVQPVSILPVLDTHNRRYKHYQNVPLFLQRFTMKTRPVLFQLPHWGDLDWTPLYIGWLGNVPEKETGKIPYDDFRTEECKKWSENQTLNLVQAMRKHSDIMSPPGLQRERKSPCLCYTSPGKSSERWKPGNGLHWPVHPSWAKPRLLWLSSTVEQSTKRAVGIQWHDSPNILPLQDHEDRLDLHRDLRHCMLLAWYNTGKCSKPQQPLSNTSETQMEMIGCCSWQNFSLGMISLIADLSHIYLQICLEWVTCTHFLSWKGHHICFLLHLQDFLLFPLYFFLLLIRFPLVSHYLFPGLTPCRFSQLLTVLTSSCLPKLFSLSHIFQVCRCCLLVFRIFLCPGLS